MKCFPIDSNNRHRQLISGLYCVEIHFFYTKYRKVGQFLVCFLVLMKGCWILWNTFLHLIGWPYPFLNFINVTTFSYLKIMKYAFISGIKPAWSCWMVLFNLLLNGALKKCAEDFYIYVHQEYSCVFFFSVNVYVGFWY